MRIAINYESGVPAFRQVVNQIQFAIASGQLSPGTKLPALRVLSEELGLNQNTVLKAYRELEILRILQPRKGRGYYVANNAPSLSRDHSHEKLWAKLFEVAAEARAAGVEREVMLSVATQGYDSPHAPYDKLSNATLRQLP